MSPAPPDMEEIMAAVALLHGGDKAGAREELLRLWSLWEQDGTPLQRCTIAHFLADTETEAEAELVWDLAALEAATGRRDTTDADPFDPALAGFLPSLHLNVGDAYRRLGARDAALAHAELGLKRAAALADDGYGHMIAGGLERLRARLLDEG